MKRVFWRRPPLFLRIFVVILAAVLGAQALNFVLVLMVRLPEPRVYLLTEIADALRTGAGSPTLQVSVESVAGDGSRDERDLRVGQLLSTYLGTTPDQVRVEISRPPGIEERKSIGDRKISLISKPMHGGEEAGVPHTDMIVGSFRATQHIADGRWRVVRPASRGIEPWQWQALLWLVGAVLLVVPVAWLLARRIAAPVDLFASAAERLGRDPSARPLSPRGPPEIVAAAEAFNAMQTRLQRYVEDRTTMVAAIAHDLRTPLMRLSVLLDDVAPATRAAADAEIREMRARISSILAFIKGVSSPTKRQRLSLRSLLESVVNERADRGADVTLDDGPDLTIDADVAGIRAMLTNLVENAVQYAGSARLMLSGEEGLVRVSVIDSGPGISPAHLDRVFEPFYRVEASRSRDTGGNGLGLASARAVARAHGGDITLSNRESGGLVVSVSLPC